MGEKLLSWVIKGEGEVIVCMGGRDEMLAGPWKGLRGTDSRVV